MITFQKLHINLNLIMKSVQCFVALVFITAVTPIASAEERFVPGDADGDGYVVGRDALLIMRIVEGLESATDDILLRGDVYPVPGTDGRTVGDGALTKEDAERILQYTVGLVSKGELSADYSNSVPRIDDFEPNCGAAGEQVAIFGSSFLTHSSEDNRVFFGKVEAEITEVMSTRILVRVPEEATTGRIRVKTVGGEAISDRDFVILVEREGNLQLDGGLDHNHFDITCGYADSSEISSTGSFFLKMPEKRLFIVAAVPRNDSEFAYMSIQPPFMDGEAPVSSIEVNADTTARALIFMHPFIMSEDPARAEMALNLMDQLEETNALADAIAERYPQGVAGIDDPVVGEAWDQAVLALIDAMPSSLLVQLDNENPAKRSSTRSRSNDPGKLRPMNPPSGSAKSLQTNMKVKAVNSGRAPLIIGADRDYTHVDYDAENHTLVPKLEPYESIFPWAAQGYSPLDWYSVLYRVHLEDMPKGLNESMSSLVNRPLNVSEYRVATAIPANQWTAKIDIVYTAIDSIVTPGYNAMFDESSLPFADGEEGVYILRNYSGCIYTDKYQDSLEFKTIEDIPGGQSWSNIATVTNIALAIVDLIDLGTGESQRWARAGLKKGVQNGVRKLTQELSNANFSGNNLLENSKEGLHILSAVAVDVAKGFSTAVPQAMVSRLKVITQLEKALERADKLLFVLDKISSLGRIGERMLALDGYIANPYDFEIVAGPTPLESFVIVVGDPFSPEIFSMDPVEGGYGTILTITGENFGEGIHENTVLFEQRSKSVVYEGRIISVEDKSTIQVEVPDELVYDESYRVVVETPSAMSRIAAPQRFSLKRIPVLTSITPAQGFTELPDNYPSIDTRELLRFEGTEIHLHGTSFEPFRLEEKDIVYFGDGVVPFIESRTDTEITFFVPDKPPGKYDIYIKSPANGDYETERFQFEILDKPVLNEVVPDSIQMGGVVKLRGDNFGYYGYQSNPLRIEVGDEILEPFYVLNSLLHFRMPPTDVAEEPMPIRVWTPAGMSETLQIVREPGITDNPTIDFEGGWTIRVNSYEEGRKADGKLTLSEAVAFADGSIYPFQKPWDDENIEVYYDKYERKNEEGETYWHTVKRSERETGSVMGTECRYIYTTWHYSGGGTKRTEKKITLDGWENSEEADYISGGDDIQGGGARYEDTIVASGVERPYEILGLELENDDNLYVDGVVDMLYSLTLNNSSFVRIGTLISQQEIPLIIKGDDNDIETRIVDSKKNAVEIMGGVRNEFEVEIDGCAGNGIEIQSGGGNQISHSTILNCQGNGIKIADSILNRINFCTIENCDLNGLDLLNSDNNEIYRLDLCLNQGHGVYLENSKDNRISANVFFHNSVNGLELFNSERNLFVKNYFQHNPYGLVLRGASTTSNVFNSNHFEPRYIDRYERPYVIDTESPQTDHGIWLTDGCNNNILRDCRIMATRSHAIVIEGASTSNNVIERCSNRGLQPEEFIGGDFVIIRNQASQNLITGGGLKNCGGNGVTIAGEGTDNNEIVSCGFSTGNPDDPDRMLYKIDGWGMEIKDGALGTIVDRSVFANNVKGGIHIHNIYGAPNRNKPSFILKHNSIGYWRRVAPLPDVFGTMDRKKYQMDKTTGIGILIENANQGYLWNNYIHGHENGFIMSSAYDFLLDVQQIVESQKNGMVIEHATNVVVTDSHCDAETMQGILLNDVSGARFDWSSGETSGTNCMTIKNSRDINLENSELGPGGQKSGLSIQQSEDVHVLRCDIYRNGENGYHAFQSNNLVFELSRADDNMLNGISLIECSDVKIFGDRPRTGMWVFNNALNGIFIENCQSIDLGYDERGVNVSGFTKDGIYITGDETKDIDITSSIVVNNGRLEGINGIHIDSGKDVVIGGERQEEGNNIEFGNEVGILIEKENTDVTILQNIIGEPEEWETGNRENGNGTGIHLTNNASGIEITGNIINANKESGIEISGGAHHNKIIANQITENGNDGVLVQGSGTVGNVISRNSISRNLDKGIELSNQGNNEIQSPVITNVNWDDFNITGVVEDVQTGSTVEVYADKEDEGLVMVGKSMLYGNNFYVSGLIPPDTALHGIVIDSQGNTSEFGPFEPQVLAKDFGNFVFVSGKEGQRDLYIYGNKLKKPRKITDHPADETDPSISEDGKKIAFVTDRNGNDDIWMIEAGKEEDGQIVGHERPDYDPDWHPERNQIVFVSERDGNPEIYTEKLEDESGPSLSGELSYFKNWFGAVQFSTPGSIFAVHFTCTPGTLKNISFFIQDRYSEFRWKVLHYAEGPTDEVIATGIDEPFEDGWLTVELEDVEVPSEFVVGLEYMSEDYGPGLGVGSVDSNNQDRWWAYNPTIEKWESESYRPFMIKAFVESEESTGPTRITNHDASDIDPCWSPQGDVIAFSSDREGDMDIWSVKEDGSELVHIVNSPGNDSKPAWSPEGDKIAFVSDRDGNKEIYLLDTTTETELRLTNHPSVDTDPVWDESGEMLLFSSNRESGFEIYSLEIDSLNSSNLTVTYLDSIQPDMGTLLLSDWPSKSDFLVDREIPSPQETFGEVTLSMEPLLVSPGEVFDLGLQVDSNVSIGNLKFSMDYDTTAFSIQDVISADLPGELMLVKNPVFYPSTRDQVIVNWVYPFGMDGNFETASYVFKALEGAVNGEYLIKIQDMYGFDREKKALSLVSEDVRITIEGDTVNVDKWMLH